MFFNRLHDTVTGVNLVKILGGTPGSSFVHGGGGGGVVVTYICKAYRPSVLFTIQGRLRSLDWVPKYWGEITLLPPLHNWGGGVPRLPPPRVYAYEHCFHIFRVRTPKTIYGIFCTIFDFCGPYEKRKLVCCAVLQCFNFRTQYEKRSNSR